jgi:hypothetical protein
MNLQEKDSISISFFIGAALIISAMLIALITEAIKNGA